jgi:hypothetical protein
MSLRSLDWRQPSGSPIDVFTLVAIGLVVGSMGLSGLSLAFDRLRASSVVSQAPVVVQTSGGAFD